MRRPEPHPTPPHTTPLQPVHEGLPRADQSAVAPGLAAHVLIVDDEPQIRDLMGETLKRWGYRVSTAEDARSALRVLRGEDIRILLTDLKMPRMNGLELIRAAREIRPQIGSILITAFASTETAVQALRSGADDYVTKPFRVDDLRATVARVLDTHRMASDERHAIEVTRQEAHDLRERTAQSEAAVARLTQDLDLSRRDLTRRVADLDFLRDLTQLLSRKTDITRMLQTTSLILGRRFRAMAARIELDLSDGIHTAEHLDDHVPPQVLSAMGPDLVRRARQRPRGVLRDLVLGYGKPLEALAASIEISGEPLGGLTLLRQAPTEEDWDGEAYLLSLVPQALAVAVESELNRRAAEANALEVATRLLQTLEDRGSLHRGHHERVARIADALCDQMGLSPRLKQVVRIAARLHDVGTVAVPDDVLSQPRALSPTELELVRTHPVVGARILEPFGEAAAFVRHHHERPDGTGYPDGLRGEEIPLGAGIIGVAEAYDAMTSSRPYRPSMRRREALGEIRRLRGTQFVSEAVDALLELPKDRL